VLNGSFPGGPKSSNPWLATPQLSTFRLGHTRRSNSGFDDTQRSNSGFENARFDHGWLADAQRRNPRPGNT
jgi:hypothetical protein